ncbi:MAG: GNAT family N-acetyltransferase [Bacillota bacterium]
MSIVCRLIRDDEAPAAMRVWAKCFPEDSGAFIRYYFEKRTSPSAVLAAFDGPDMIGALHMLDCSAWFFGMPRRVGFVAGVGTIPEARGRGVGAKMLRASFSIMRGRGFEATILQPSSPGLFHFYRNTGYETLSSAVRLERGFDPQAPRARLIDPSPASMLSAFEAFTEGYDGVILRTEQDFALLLEEAKITNCPIYASETAYALGERAEDRLELTEIAGSGVMELVNAIAEAERKTVAFQLPADHELSKGMAAEPFDMLRILDVEAFLTGIPARDGRYRIAIEDADLAENTGTYEFFAEGGRVMSCERVDGPANERMDIGALAGNIGGTLPGRFALRGKPCFGMKHY